VALDDVPRIPLGNNVLYPLALRDGGVFLVDAGPDIPTTDTTEESWPFLGAQLAAHGIEARDVRFALVTHAHLDHAGLAYRWAAEGATVLAGAADLAAIERGQASRDAQRRLQLADLLRHGCPPDVIEGMRSPRGRHPAGLRWEPCPGDALEPAGATYDLEGGRTLRVIDAPGHTPGNVVAFIPETGELFSGDTILPTTVPTPGMHYPQAVEGVEDAPRWPSLPPFITSVASLRTLDVRRILPGHGQPVEDPDRLFERFEEHHARRARRVRVALLDGPATTYEVAKRMFPRIPPRRLGQAITEVLGHLDMLEAAGEVEVVREGEVVRYGLVG
jgi:glyoxylase-like metal-dependent hydrolase (beta-lactamase superfamily II)